MRAWLVVLAFAVAACQAKPSGATDAPVRFIRVFTQGADATAPLVVWIHGRGGKPERFEGWWREFPGKIEVVIPQGFLPSGDGWSWYDWPPGMTEDDLADAVSASADRLWRAIAEVAHGRKVIVAGFSQGAILSYALAARHPDEIRYAFPIAGRLPPRLYPTGPAAPVYAMHGTADDVIEADYGRAAVRAFKNAELRELPGVGHTITPEMRADLVARIGALIEPTAR